jgi:hypothetical protein
MADTATAPNPEKLAARDKSLHPVWTILCEEFPDEDQGRLHRIAARIAGRL